MAILIVLTCGLAGCKTPIRQPNRIDVVRLDVTPGTFVYDMPYLKELILTKSKSSPAQRDSLKHLLYIEEINKFKNYYVIYAWRNDSIFKIVSEEKSDSIVPYQNRIERGKYYDVNLRVYDDNKKMHPVSYLKFAPIDVDGRLTIGYEPEKGITELYVSDELNGLYILK